MSKNKGLKDVIDSADSAFDILLVVTTIMSGAYIGLCLDWVSLVFEGPARKLEIFLGSMFALIILWPLVIVIIAYAISKFRGFSVELRTVSSTGLIYCLSQDVLATVITMLVALGAVGMVTTRIAWLLPVFAGLSPVFAVVLGYRIALVYGRALPEGEIRRGRYALIVLLTVFAIGAIRVLLILPLIPLGLTPF
ncbi:MAG: hypothetical protein ACE5OY_09135 [Candidatus Bathyarchaeia archaeon]